MERRIVRDWRYLAVAAAVVGVAFLLRVYQIGEEELWFDEAASFSLVTWRSWPEALLRDINPPFYYLLLSAWLRVAGQSEAALRLLSALSGTLFIVALLLFGRRIVGPRAALWSALVAALAPIQIYYSQEARTYALLTLLLALTYGALWRGLESDKRRWWVVVSVCALLALYSHYFAVLALIPTALLVWLWPEGEQAKQRWLHYAASMSVSVLLWVPWILWSFHSRSYSVTGIGWIESVWQGTGPLLAIPRSLEVFTLGGQADFISAMAVKRFGNLLLPEWLRLGGLAVAALLGIWVSIPWMDSHLTVPWLKRKKVWLWTMLLFPLGALWLISFYKPVYAVGRYEIVAFPAYALLLGLALAKVQSVPKAGALVALIAAFCFFLPIGAKMALYYGAAARQLARPTALAIHRFVNDGDVVVLSRTRSNTTIYYLTRLGYQWNGEVCEHRSTGRRFRCRVFPARRTPPANADDAARQDVGEIISDLRPRENTLWVLFDPVSKSSAYSFLLGEIERLELRPFAVMDAPDFFQFR